MPRENKTEYLVLGALHLGPMTGYDIHQLVSESIGYFWQESYGQIYPVLKRLHQQGCVKRRIRAQEGKPNRHEYSITATGRERFQEWLAAEPDRERVRHELLLKLFFAKEGAADDQLRHLESYRSQQEEKLKTFEWIKTGYFEPMQDDPNRPYWEITLSYGVHLARARLAWAEESIRRVKKLNRKSSAKGQKVRR